MLPEVVKEINAAGRKGPCAIRRKSLCGALFQLIVTLQSGATRVAFTLAVTVCSTPLELW